ncbi:MAG: aminotransferase class I/II-fold pyridoxal phosphate-dependent enzyme, partial [Bacillota bacterium]|nr:aminotransferase class I/II-fold pyridoxal phosphate-dependent enzyme [Bacillota bacterium]
RRDIIVDGLNKIPGVTCMRPCGSFYVFPNISSFGMSSMDFATGLLQQTGVVATPGSAFGDAGEGYLRMAFSNSEENIIEAVRRMSDYCGKLK